MRRFVFCTIAFVIGGCSLFVDLDGLSGAGDGGAADVFAGDGTRADAGTDGSAPVDGGPDANRLICPDASIVCDDFDDDTLGAKWSGSENQNGAAAIDNGEAFSQPNSMHMTLPDNPDSVIRIERVYEDFDSLTSLDCRFQVRLGATDDGEGDDVDIFQVYLNATGFNLYELDINMRKGDFDLEQDTDTGEDGGAASTTDMFGAVDAGTWQPVRLTTDFKTVQVYIDGVVVYDQTLMTPFPDPTAKGTFSVGLVEDGEPSSWDYRIDDVVCTGQ